MKPQMLSMVLLLSVPRVQVTVGMPAPLEVEDGHRQEMTPQCRTHIAVVLKHGRTELVVVRVAALAEQNPSGRVDQIVAFNGRREIHR